MSCIVGWDSDRKDFVGIITVRDLMEMLVFLCESIKAVIKLNEKEVSVMTEQEFITFFKDKYFYNHTVLQRQDSSVKADVNSLKLANNEINVNLDFSLIPKILQ